VQDDRQRGGDRNRPEMRLDSRLHRLVVVGHHREHGVGAGSFRALRQFDRLTGRIGSGPGDDPDAAPCHLDGGSNDAFPFRGRQSGGFAAGFADQDGSDAGIYLALAKFRNGCQIDGTMLIERRGNVGYVARKPGGGH
jgi:hypothetical protein